MSQGREERKREERVVEEEKEKMGCGKEKEGRREGGR